MTVHLCDNDRPYIDCFSKGISLSEALLTNRAVHNENNVVWIHSFLYLFHLVKKLSFLFVTTRSIKNDDLHSIRFKVSDSFLGNRNRISFNITTIERNSNLCCILFKLIEGTSSESISTNHTNSPSFFLIVVSNFAASCCFSTSLQSNEHYYVRFASLRLIRFFLYFEKGSQLFYYCSFDQSSKVSAFLFFTFELIHNVLSELHYVSDIYIAAEKSIAYLFQTFFHGLFV